MPSRQLTLPRLPKSLPTRRPQNAAPVAGIRIGATHVSVAVAAPASGPLAPRIAASAPLPAGAVKNGEVVDAVAVAQALRQAVAGHSGLGKQARIGVGCQKVAVRVIDLPPVQREEDVVAAVRMLAKERIPTAADNALIDYRLLPDGVTENGQPQKRALVVAARRELVDGHVAAVRAAGLDPVGVDLLAFGLSRTVRPSAATLLLDLDGVTTLAISGRDDCRFVRTIPAGIGTVAEDLAQRTGGDVAAVEAALLGDRSGVDYEQDEEGPAIARTIRAIASTVRTSIDFHVEQEDGTAPETCVISGPLAALPGVAALLHETLGLPVESAGALSGGADPVALGLSVEEVR
ncbi:pilus assembly protein PilM [Patulibacter minatonensis]|uniref:pilus assembly protein PilM n=1 Tax=Patulibacter minatonensis TaxID=298163 RepID=UPI00047E61E1|nr:pilus assembly protein PilM [Patulibacter minatonensis]